MFPYLLNSFDIYDIKPYERVDKAFIPALFVAGADDDFIRPHHAQDLHDKYSGDKNIFLCDGDHNALRPQYLLDRLVRTVSS